jgi:hypothetical protein
MTDTLRSFSFVERSLSGYGIAFYYQSTIEAVYVASIPLYGCIYGLGSVVLLWSGLCFAYACFYDSSVKMMMKIAPDATWKAG